MELNENIIKNIASEITRECQAKGTTVDTEFVGYLIELLLLNPKHNKLLSKSANRNNLELFVNSCVFLLTSGNSSVNTVKIQHIFHSNYGSPAKMVDKHVSSIETCLKPLVFEIVDAYPDMTDSGEMKKLFRKISIYILLASGLGNPGVIMTLKEGMAALDSVFSLEDLHSFIGLPRGDKVIQLRDLVEIVSGVRLFNRDCKKGGEGIHDLPFDLEDATKACLVLLSNKLVSIMHCVNSVTSAIDDVIFIEQETGSLIIQPANGVTRDDYTAIFGLLAFYRQLEVCVRRLLSDVEMLVQDAKIYVDKMKLNLEEVHSGVKYKAAVPVITVFPLFVKLWQVWRDMQNSMYLVSTVNNVTSMLTAQQDHVKIPSSVLKIMLRGKSIVTDQERVNRKVGLETKMSVISLKSFVPYNDTNVRDRHIQYLGFCAICVCKGALVPCNPKLGVMKVDGTRFGFCSAPMAATFSHDPQRYINKALEFIRSNPHYINLLNVMSEVKKVRNIEHLVIKIKPKLNYYEKEVQTELHPIPQNIVKDYNWNLWEYKKQACQWASIVNYVTHSTQTKYSHLRSEIQCQTTENRDKSVQTRKDGNTDGSKLNSFAWGLRGQYGKGHLWKWTENNE